jgi:hypothetical protein
VHKNFPLTKDENISTKGMKKYIYSAEELSSIYQFPHKPSGETSLLKVTAQKLALPI